MTIERMIELLEIEHECILRGSHDDCDRNCADCELVQDDGDLHEMYTDVIALLKKNQEAVEPIFVENPYTHLPVSYCSKCREPINQYITGNPYRKTEYCHYCGQAVKWNDLQGEDY